MDTALSIQTLLKRTTLQTSFQDILDYIETAYPSIGKINKTQPILQGYEDANFILSSQTGTYVLKLFLYERSQKNIDDYVAILKEMKDRNIPTVEMIKGNNGYLDTFGTAPFIVTRFTEGKSFEHTTPTMEDINVVADYLSQINLLQIQVEECNDSWGNKNLLQEYEENKHIVDPQTLKDIVPVIDLYRSIDMTKLSRSFIHGDLQRKHILKNSNGKYCILDFGCMSYGPKVFDLSTFLAWFCIQPDTVQNQKEIEKNVIEIYTRYHDLSPIELDALPTLVKGSYAAYLMKTSILIAEGDTSEETKQWNQLANEMLEKYRSS